MLKIKRNKKLMIPVIAMILVVAMAGAAFAAMPTDIYSDWDWTQFDLNTVNSYQSRQTRLIQRACNALGGFGLDADGIYGVLTKGAVEMVQDTVGLTADGACGDDTWEAFQMDYNWTKSSLQYWSNKGEHYYYYYSVGSSAECIRHCEDGDWYALDDDNVNWYKVN